MANIPFRKILGLNQQTYQRLKLSLSLNLRRQIFVAVCDDLVLRDRLAAQLQTDINKSVASDAPSPPPATPQSYPRLVSLQLALDDPNPLIQVARWLTQNPPPSVGGRQTTMPAFQILGSELLTRQSASVQRLFFTHLQAIERNLPLLDSGLLIWMTQPWFHALPQSAPEFWRCRTGVFEFIGDPTPLIATSPEWIGAQLPQTETPSSASPVALSAELPAEPIDTELSDSDISDIEIPLELPSDLPPDETPSELPFEPVLETEEEGLENPFESESESEAEEESSENPWLSLADDLVHWYEAPDEAPLNGDRSLEPVDQGLSDEAASNGNGSNNGVLHLPPTNDSSSIPEPGETEDIDDLSANAPPSLPPPEKPQSPPDGETIARVSPKAKLVDRLQLNGASITPVKQQETPASTSVSASASIAAAAESGTLATLPIKLPQELLTHSQTKPIMQQIELLHQQQAPPTVLANAYRTLGNLYRDRIEQGEATSQNLTIAIQAYEQVLLWLPESSPLWVDVLNDLGNFYWMLSRAMPNPTEAFPYLQQGVRAYQLALTKVNPQTQAHTYPMVQNNLGAAYADLARHQDPVQHLQLSIQAYRQALRYRRAETDPLRYASTQNNLGTTYWNLAQYQQPVANLKQAITAYSEALHHYNPEQEPLNYAMIQNNLGTAYWNLAQHERPQDWLMLALAAYRMALKYRTLELAPSAHAATQNNLGTAYWHIANHAESPQDRLEYLKQAVTAYGATLLAADHIAKRQPNVAYPILNFDLFATHNNLGLAHYQVATDLLSNLDANAQAQHLQAALKHHVTALQGWSEKPDLRQTAFNCVVQTVRAFYNQLGISGQSIALSMIPGHLMPEVLPKL